jgi:hypothetical protein
MLQFLVLPPLPGKKDSLVKVAEQFFSSDDSNQNQQLCYVYQNFLIRLGRHPILAKLIDVSEFLKSTADEYLAIRKRVYTYPKSYAPRDLAGWFSNLNKPSLRDDKLLSIYQQISDWKEYLSHLQTHALSMRNKYAELCEVHQSFTSELKKLPLNPLLKPESGASFPSQSANGFNSFIESFTGSSKKMNIQAQLNETLLDDRFESWIRYSTAAMEAIERYAALDADYRETLNSFETKSDRMATLRNANSGKKATSSAEEQRIHELAESLKKVDANLKSLTTLWNTARNSIYQEVQRFDKYKLNEFNSWMKFYGHSNYLQFSELTKSWADMK